MIFTEREIDRVVQSIIDFRKKWRETRHFRIKEEQKITNKKKRSQQKNWSKRKKRK
ncbi:hypothetical protein [Alkalihalobacterium alkalinitrilicum]|uniref:hypothetical protein n=1 Tax=Alkalihalobacterium alkalinitrilicum TaxID=427920 RepID=UPI0013036132|nr:hypothetical protein [Alkalihalobacterium alkalinitrilicum]